MSPYFFFLKLLDLISLYRLNAGWSKYPSERFKLSGYSCLRVWSACILFTASLSLSSLAQQKGFLLKRCNYCSHSQLLKTTKCLNSEWHSQEVEILSCHFLFNGRLCLQKQDSADSKCNHTAELCLEGGILQDIHHPHHYGWTWSHRDQEYLLYRRPWLDGFPKHKFFIWIGSSQCHEGSGHEDEH